MLNILPIIVGKLISFASKILNVGAGSTWPGHFALSLNKNFIKNLAKKNPPLKIILIAGTNGKTTTAKMVTAILASQNKTFFQNAAGANLLNGIASSFIQNADIHGKIEKDFAVFEIDENALGLILKQTTPYAIILLNLFRDQLDRYGELDSVAKKWKEALLSLGNLSFPLKQRSRAVMDPRIKPEDDISKNFPFLILNADDPLIAYVGKSLCHSERSVSEVEESNSRNNADKIDPSTRYRSVGITSKIFYFGLPESNMEKKSISHGADSIYCPKCNNKLTYSNVAYSHLGHWHCENCNLQRPKNIVKNSVSSPLPGLYNSYNTQAASTLGKILNLSDKQIESSLKSITPAFGRQEIIKIKEKKIQIFLSKNPISFNQSLETILDIESGIYSRDRHSGKPKGHIQNLLIIGGKRGTSLNTTEYRDSGLARMTNLHNITVLFVLNDRIPDGRDVSWIWDTDLEQYSGKLGTIIVSGDRCYDMALRIQYAQGISNFPAESRGARSGSAGQDHTSRDKYQINDKSSNEQEAKLIIKECLKDAITEGLKLINHNETLYILPTYSAMLEVRKILIGRKIL